MFSALPNVIQREVDGLKKLESLPIQHYNAEAEIIYGDQYSADSVKANYIHNKKAEFITKCISEKKSINISGKEAFELFDTFGFPFDLTRLIALEYNWQIDDKGFKEELQKQKERSRAASVQDVDDWQVIQDGNTEFVGYNLLETRSKVLKYRKIKSKGKEQYQIVLNITPFYAESGGQVGDKGTITLSNNFKVIVTDTKK